MYDHDVIVVGGGGAGLRAAIAAADAGADVAIVSKLKPVRSHTGAAEGGVNAALDEADSVADHVYDTVKGADYLGDVPAIEAFADEIREEVIRLEQWGMAFSRNDDGTIAKRPFGGMDTPRTAFAGAETGHHLLHTLYQQVLKRDVTVYDEWFVVELAVGEAEGTTTCHGCVGIDVATGEVAGFRARDGIILATGGNGQVYDHTTNATANTGDGMAMAYRVGVPLQDMEFVQFHPTTLPSTGVLITEGVRGEGGILYNSEGERFMYERGYAPETGELASRDVVSRAELTEVAEGRGVSDDCVYLDMRHLGKERMMERLEHVVNLAREFEGVDPVEEPIPVKPGHHYAMGGIEVDEYGATCVDGLYAAGECACISLHGANRLGGNALGELLVFGARAGRHAAGEPKPTATIETGGPPHDVPVIDVGATVDTNTSGHMAPVDPVVRNADDGGDVLQTATDEVQTRINTLRSGGEGESHATIRSQVQETMTANVNVFRQEAALERALADLADARATYRDITLTDTNRQFNYELIGAIETQNIIDIAEPIVAGALERTEFRGAHWRQEHQKRDDEEWLKHTNVTWNTGNPQLWYRPVVLEGKEGEYEPTEREY